MALEGVSANRYFIGAPATFGIFEIVSINFANIWLAEN
jgi:hypothetical protein